MSYLASSENIRMPAPCIVDNGIIVNRQDIQKLLSDLGHVRYHYCHGDDVVSDGEGYVLDVFTDANQSTLVANASLYINICSFDYLELARSPAGETTFKLIQDNQMLILIPLSNPVKRQCERAINSATIETIVAEVLSANIDMHLDSDDTLSF